jgi:hypothetical protein
VGDFNIPLSPIIGYPDTTPTKKINRETSELNNTLDQMDLTDIYRIFHPTATRCIFFSVAHGTFSKIDTILG